MKSNNLLLLAAVFYSTVFSFAQPNIKIEVIPVDSVGKLVISETDLNFDASDSINSLKKLKQFSDFWINKGYLASGFDSILFDSLSIKAWFYLGSALNWDKLRLDGVSESIVRKAGFSKRYFEKKSFGLKEFLILREEIVNYYEDIGYPFVQVRIDSLSFSNDQIIGNLNISTNEYFLIDSIFIKGNPKISRKYLNYYIDIKPGEVYNQSKINNLDNEIESLPYLEMGKPSEIEFREGKADIYLYIKNRQANFFNGIIGFASGTEEEPDFQITGDLNLILVNAFKIGEQFEIKWNKYSANSQNLKIALQVPYLFIMPIGLDMKFGLEKYNIDYLNTSLYGGIEYSFSSRNKIKVYASQNNSYLIDNEEYVGDTLAGSSRFTAGLTFIVDKTDYRFNPRTGFYLEASSGYGNRDILNTNANELIEYALDAAVFLKVGQAGTIALINHSAGMYSDIEFFSNELFKIGGINDLRGFDEQSINASSYSVFSIEPRLLFGKNSAFYVFGDFAWYESKLINNQTSDTPFGFGIGMNVDTRAGIFKINYALGKQFNNPIKFSDSKVHFGFSARF